MRSARRLRIADEIAGRRGHRGCATATSTCAGTRMQDNMRLRHRITMAIRRYFDGHDFLEIETPILTKSTPEGARDYLVPSRVHPGEFFALPQSPQLFKQILMIGGLDRYFQIVKCFRDEDLRADRQPEFTQVDVEISFASEELVFSHDRTARSSRSSRKPASTCTTPFRRMPYHEAMHVYGSDKPDLRCGMEIQDLSTGVRRDAVRADPAGARRRRRASAASSCQAARRWRVPKSTASSPRRSNSAPVACCGPGRRRRA